MFEEMDVSWISTHLVEELLAAGTLLLLLPRRLAKPGPARAPRPPDIQTKKKPSQHYSQKNMELHSPGLTYFVLLI